MKRTFFGSGTASVQAFLAGLSPENRQTAKDIFMENFHKEQLLHIEPWFSQEIDGKNIDIILLQAKDFNVTSKTIDDLYKKAKRFGLRLFEPGLYQKLDLSFYNPLPREQQHIVVLLEDAEWHKEVLIGSRNSGDEYDGEFPYDYKSLTLPTILSGTKRDIKTFEDDSSYYNDHHCKGRLREDDYFLLYALHEEVPEPKEKEPELQEEWDND